MVHTSFWVEAHLWGQTRAARFHADNVLLHAAAAVLLWRALAALAVPWPWVAAAAFAVHPVTVESVAWVTERKNVLSLVFYLLAFHAYRRFQTEPTEPGRPRPGAGRYADPRLARPTPDAEAATLARVAVRRTAPPRAGDGPALTHLWYAGSLALFLLALLSKTVTCSLPAAILLVAYWKQGRVTRADVRPLLPMFAVGLLLAAVTGHLERTQVGATGHDFDLSPAHRILIAGRAVWFYAGKLAWPTDLLFMYPRWTVDPGQLWQWAYPAAAVGVVVALFLLRHKLGRGPLVAVLFFAGTLTPALGFANVYPMRYSFVADHFQYLAAIGLVPLYVSTIALAAGRWRLRRSEYVRSAVATVILVPLAWLTWRQQVIYADRFTLWTDTVRRNPGSWMAHINLASAYDERGDKPAALRETLLALRMAGDEADPHYSYGSILAARGDWPAAIGQFRAATELGPHVPATWDALASALWKHGTGPADRAAAFEAAERAVARNPYTVQSQLILSEVAGQMRDPAAAVAHAEKAAAAATPTDVRPHVRLGDALMGAGRYGDAAAAYGHALAVDPRDAAVQTNFGFAARLAGRPDQAAAAFSRALTIDPNFAPARQAWAEMRAK